MSSHVQDGATPLTITSMCGHVELVEFLLSNGADSSVKMVCFSYNYIMSIEFPMYKYGGTVYLNHMVLFAYL